MDGKRILLIGAEPANGGMTEDLVNKGNTVEQVDTVDEALTCIQRFRPSVAFVNLPERSAVERFEENLRDRGIDLPIVLVGESEEARAWAEDLGAAAFAPHPARLEGDICENLDTA